MNGSEWAQFAKEQAARRARPLLSQPPAGLDVDAACPDCQRAEYWTRVQVLGETPGLPGIPAQRGGVVMKCYGCGAQYAYRDVAFTEAEQIERTRQLFQNAKTGKVPL